MYEAKLNDPTHGKHIAQAATAEEAVEKAFQAMADGWRNPNDPIVPFDGTIEAITDDVSEVWWWDDATLLGTVRKL